MKDIRLHFYVLFAYLLKPVFLQVDGHWEEYFDYIFPDDEGAKPNLRLLAIAKSWKKGSFCFELVMTCS